MINKAKKVTVKAVFKKDGRILCVKDLKGIWELPGGKIDGNEQPEEALKRELAEELGWNKVNIKNIIDAWSFSSEEGDVRYRFVVLVYVCTTEEEAITESSEYIEYRWVPIAEIETLSMRDGYKKTISKLLSTTLSS